MACITFPRDQFFRGWTEGETSKVVGKKDFSDKEIEKEIAQHHTSESHEPYFYSWRIVSQTNPARVNRESQKTQRLVLLILASVAVSVIVYLMTRSYFDSAWKACQAIADNKEYLITTWSMHPEFDHLWPVGEKLSWPEKFIRYATAADIWNMHSTGAPGLFFLRNAFCLLFPVGGFFGVLALDEKKEVNYEPEKIYSLVIDRSKDDRVFPPNFDIQKDCDPLTQEPISVQKLHSPQMIYLPNYVTDAKSFVSALLIAGKKDFLDPVDQREFTEEERKQILSQIKRIFLISEERFKDCFEAPWISAFPTNSECVEDQIPVVQLRDRVRSFIEKTNHATLGFLGRSIFCERNKAYLPENDVAYLRVLQFENKTGVSLKKPQLQNGARPVPVVCACADCSWFRSFIAVTQRMDSLLP